VGVLFYIFKTQIPLVWISRPRYRFIGFSWPLCHFIGIPYIFLQPLYNHFDTYPFIAFSRPRLQKTSYVRAPTTFSNLYTFLHRDSPLFLDQTLWFQTYLRHLFQDPPLDHRHFWDHPYNYQPDPNTILLYSRDPYTILLIFLYPYHNPNILMEWPWAKTTPLTHCAYIFTSSCIFNISVMLRKKIFDMYWYHVFFVEYFHYSKLCYFYKKRNVLGKLYANEKIYLFSYKPEAAQLAYVEVIMSY